MSAFSHGFAGTHPGDSGILRVRTQKVDAHSPTVVTAGPRLHGCCHSAFTFLTG